MSEVLKNLRADIVLNSLFLRDYENRYDLPEKEVALFFDGYLDFLEDRMEDEIEGFNDAQFFDHLPAYDTTENLETWFDLVDGYIGGVKLEEFFRQEELAA